MQAADAGKGAWRRAEESAVCSENRGPAPDCGAVCPPPGNTELGRGGESELMEPGLIRLKIWKRMERLARADEPMRAACESTRVKQPS